MDEPSAPARARSGTISGEIAARVDRIPVTWHMWAYALIAQTFWGGVLALDNLAIRIYPVVWEPQHAFSPLQYTILVGCQNGLGVLIGQVWFTHLSDRHGRKPIMILSCLVGGLFSIPFAFTSNWYLLVVFATIAAVGVGGTLGSANVYVSELAPPARRNRVMLGAQVWAAVLVNVITGLLPVFLVPAHYELWVVICGAIILLVVLPLIVFFLVESPRWLEARGRAADAEQAVSLLERRALTRIAKLPPPTIDLRPVVVARQKVPVSEIFRGRYGRRTVVLLLIWVLGYLGLDYGMSSFQSVYMIKHLPASDLFLILFIGGLIGTAGFTAAGALLGERVERKTLIGVAGVMTFVGALLYFFFPDSLTANVIATILCSGAVLGWAFNSYNYTATAYPTRLRATASGFTEGVAHIGALLGPVFAGFFYALPIGPNHISWFIYFAVFGGLLPAFIAMAFGVRQRGAVLEDISG